MRNGNTEAHTNHTILGYFKKYFKEDKSEKIAKVYPCQCNVGVG